MKNNVIFVTGGAGYIGSHVCKALKAVEFERRAGDSTILVADASLARTLLNWSPKYSDLETIISTAWKWKQRQL